MLTGLLERRPHLARCSQSRLDAVVYRCTRLVHKCLRLIQIDNRQHVFLGFGQKEHKVCVVKVNFTPVQGLSSPTARHTDNVLSMGIHYGVSCTNFTQSNHLGLAHICARRRIAAAYSQVETVEITVSIYRCRSLTETNLVHLRCVSLSVREKIQKLQGAKSGLYARMVGAAVRL